MKWLAHFAKKKTSLYPIRSARSLLGDHKTRVAEIRAIVGVPRVHWKALYEVVLLQFAVYIQELPASEVHHHSGRGGLLTHGIETLVNALRIRNGKLLPPDADAETVTRYKDVWTYAVFTAALAHDLGKPITDTRMELFDKREKTLGTWSPFAPPITERKDATYYKVTYVRQRVHGAHERASGLCVHRLIPQVGLDWLLSSPDVFTAWTNCISGHMDEAGLLGQIVHEADRQSVAHNLAGDQVHVESAADTIRKPLHQRVVTCLRNEIDTERLPINRSGAAGWLVDGSMWLVSKRVLDHVRAAMAAEGQTGIPGRNDRIMDELQQYRVVIPCGDKAIWRCHVFAEDWPKAIELTLLRCPAERLWTDPGAMPQPFNGTVTPIEMPAQPSDEAAEDAGDHPAAVPDAANDEPAEPVVTTVSAPTIDFSQLAAVPTDSPGETDGGADSEDDSNTGESDNEPEPILLTPVSGAGVSEKKGTLPFPSVVIDSGSQSDPPKQHGMAFVHWLRDGLHKRSIDVNAASARVHMTKEGLFLVSPAIFKQYDKHNWKPTQNQFTKLKLHEKNAQGGSIHTYIAAGKRRQSELNGFLITDTDAMFPNIEMPITNYALSRKEEAA